MCKRQNSGRWFRATQTEISEGLKTYGRYAAGVLGLALAAWFYLALPNPLFDTPYSTVLHSAEGELLGATVAADGQWRFPPGAAVPEKFIYALVAAEDKRFYSHPGIDPLALARAATQNLRAGKIVRGGSTLTMQVVRLAHHQPPRTFAQKIKEALLALRLELALSKQEIAERYAAHAPFGGNVVGLEAACWRYFQRPADALSWSEACLLAVLPNQPSLIHPGKNRAVLLTRRNRLLKRLFDQNTITETDYRLALAELLPDRPLPLPRMAPHLLHRAQAEGFAQQRIISTVSAPLQARVQAVVSAYHPALRARQIANVAALVLDVRTGQVRAYIGNVQTNRGRHEQVDVVRAPRSTGSILKPFLYAALLDEGKLLPGMLQPDVPTQINGFAPQNFLRRYDGAVPAHEALTRSLNVPAVHQLRTYRYEKFYRLLVRAGITTLRHPPEHYGLSLILGGAEGTLWDITGAYASMGRTLLLYANRPGSARYLARTFQPASYVVQAMADSEWTDRPPVFSAGAIWQTLQTLREVNRPSEESGWKNFAGAKAVAWKTGTSIGFRDGWAVGLTPDWAVGVWVGNADGEGRPGLTGTDAAAPLLFSIFHALPVAQSWFSVPVLQFRPVQVCAKSGYKASAHCPEIKTTDALQGVDEIPVCPFHPLVHLSADGKHRVHASCYPLSGMRTQPWFVLPPIQEFYYRATHLSYQPLPPYRGDCHNPASITPIELIYPRPHTRIFIPRTIDGGTGQVVFQATHRESNKTLFWHVNGDFICSTRSLHQVAMAMTKGKHVITLLDYDGHRVQTAFEVVSD